MLFTSKVAFEAWRCVIVSVRPYFRWRRLLLVPQAEPKDIKPFPIFGISHAIPTQRVGTRLYLVRVSLSAIVRISYSEWTPFSHPLHKPLTQLRIQPGCVDTQSKRQESWNGTFNPSQGSFQGSAAVTDGNAPLSPFPHSSSKLWPQWEAFAIVSGSCSFHKWTPFTLSRLIIFPGSDRFPLNSSLLGWCRWLGAQFKDVNAAIHTLYKG